METLRVHIDQLGLSQNEFADLIGVSRGYLSQILSGKRAPSREMILKIHSATDGRVPPAVWFQASGDAA